MYAIANAEVDSSKLVDSIQIRLQLARVQILGLVDVTLSFIVADRITRYAMVSLSTVHCLLYAFHLRFDGPCVYI